MKKDSRDKGTRRQVEEAPSNRPAAGDLEQYRRLIKLQRQMIELARQNEKAKRECDALREKVAREIAASLARRSLTLRLRLKAKKVLKRLQGSPAPAAAAVTLKEPLLC
jgi:hypothetical protein